MTSPGPEHQWRRLRRILDWFLWLYPAAALEQIAARQWGTWLTKNFALSRMTAYRYMRLAQVSADRTVPDTNGKSLEAAIGERPSDHSRRVGAWQPIREFTARSPLIGSARSGRLWRTRYGCNRELASQLVEIGYRALEHFRIDPAARQISTQDASNG